MHELKSALFSRVALILFSLLGLVLYFTNSKAGKAEAVQIKIGILAKRGPELCLAKWEATAKYLTEEIPGYTFTITPLSYRKVRPAIEQGEVDFILTNPAQYVDLEADCGVMRLVTLKNLLADKAVATYSGVIFTRADREDIRSLADLKNKMFMAVNKTSLGGWLMAWRELKDQGIDPRKHFAVLHFGDTQDAVVNAVRKGEVDAGTVRSDTLERMADEGKVQLEEFYVIRKPHEHHVAGDPAYSHSTRHYPEWPLAKLRHTPNTLAEQVAVALIRMSPDSNAACTAQCAGWTVFLNYQPVRECMKALSVGPYRDMGRASVQDLLKKYWPYAVGAIALGLLIILMAAYVAQLNHRLRQTLSIQHRKIADRKYFQKKILEISEREQKRMGQNLHDGVGQELTGIALMSKVLEQKLKLKSSPEITLASEIRRLVNQTISQTNSLIRMLFPVQIEIHGLDRSLQAMASQVQTQFKISCRFQCDKLDLIQDNTVATQLYYIAKEAVHNAIKHGKPKHVLIHLFEKDNRISLIVKDDGIGFPAKPEPGKGMGLHIMKYRAEMIDAGFAIQPEPHGGTLVICSRPNRTYKRKGKHGNEKI